MEDEIKQKYVINNIKEEVRITGVMKAGERAELSMSCGSFNVNIKGAVVQNAANRPMGRGEIEAQACKLGATEFEAVSVDIECGDNIFAPKSSLNELRRNASDALREKILDSFRRKAVGKCIYEMVKNKPENRTVNIYAAVMTLCQAEAVLNNGADRIYAETELMEIPELINLRKLCREHSVEFFIAMPRVVRNDEKSGRKWLSELLAAFDTDKPDGFLIRNMAQFYELKDRFKCKYTADYTLYAFNDMAAGILKGEGFSQTVYPVELNEKELGHLDISDGELIIYGKIPFMVSAGCIDNNTDRCHVPGSAGGNFTDRKGAVNDYLACCRYCYNIIYNNVPLFLMDKCDDVKNTGAASVSLRFSGEDGNEAGRLVRMASDAFRQGIRCEAPDRFTRGHFTRGVE